MKILCTMSLIGFVVACKPSGPEDKSSSSIVMKDGYSSEEAVRDYPSLMCANVASIKLRTDAKAQLERYCLNGLPTKEFTEYRTRALENTTGKQQLVKLVADHDPVTEFSHYVIAWAFHVPIRPFEAKMRPIYQFVTKPYKSELIEMRASSRLRTEDLLDSGLHLWSVDTTYDASVNVTGGIILSNKRKSQYNLYQVQSGNEELGLGVEHLLDDPSNSDYKRATMINLSFNDGQGYNDDKGGMIVITMLDFELKNQGFPKASERAIMEVAQFMADNMYEGLKTK